MVIVYIQVLHVGVHISCVAMVTCVSLIHILYNESYVYTTRIRVHI